MLSMLAGLILAAWPSHLTVATGGMSVEANKVSRGCWHDPKTGYFLYKSLECDGSHRHIALTMDRRMVTNAGFEVARFGRKPDYTFGKIEERSLALTTKHGVAIGMSRDEVVKRLGEPSRTAVRGKKKEFWCALYKQIEMTDRENGQVLRNTYIFKEGKLIEISIHLDSIPGCGGEHAATSDKGWPWSQF